MIRGENMKRILAAFLLMSILLCACSGSDADMDRALALRSRMQSGGCRFEAVVTADYGDYTCSFTLDCQSDRQGNLTFTVNGPETIAGITGSIENGSGKLTFDDKVLAFSLLADGMVTPVSAPWILVKALLGGYILAVGPDGDHTRLTVKDTYEDDALTLDVWLTQDDVPVHAEILWEDRRILTIEIKNFSLL